MDPSVINLVVLAPIVWAGIGAMLVLLGEVIPARTAAPTPEAEYRLSVRLAVISSIALLIAIYTSAAGFAEGTRAEFNPAHPMVRLDPLSSFAMFVIGIGALLSIWLSITYIAARHINHGEYYALVLLATAGMFVMVSAVDTIALYVGLELMSVPVYVLAAFDRDRLRSNEAGLKYFLVGAFASAILLYGLALLYGVTGHTGFAGLREAFDSGNPLAMAGLGLVLVGFAFKVAAVPFHQWAPDVYEGAPTCVTAFMSVAVKVAAFVVLLRFLALAIPEATDSVVQVLWLLAALSMIVGNAMAVIQTNVKRMLAYSSVAHAGYLLIGFVAASRQADAAVLFYLLAYLFTNLGAFGIVVALARSGEECELVDDFAGLARQRPGLAALMTLFLLSLAGIPGTAGFVAKFYVFSAAVAAGQVPLAILGVLTSVVSVYYYLRLPVAMYMREPAEEERARASTSELMVLTLCAAAVLLLGLLPDAGPLPGLTLAGRAVSLLP